MRRVVVVGAGVAGTAAALAAARGGSEVTVIAGGTGASVLAGGAIDDVGWEDAEAHGEPASLAASARDVLDALGAYDVGPRRSLVVATTGLVRSARGVNRALLNLASLSRTTVLVVDLRHGAWDAAALSRAWSASPRAKARELRFVPALASLLARTEEHALPDVDLAARHDDPARLVWLAERLREARARLGLPRDVGAIVLPPWLGVTHERATALSGHVGVPCGEALGGVGGPSGLRFEHARDRAFAAAGVTVVQDRASSVRHMQVGAIDRPWRGHVLLVALEGASAQLECEAAILATGGLLGGGLEYTPSGATFANALPDTPRPLLRVTCNAPVRLGARGRPLDDPSSLFGGAPELHAWPYADDPLLDHVGVLVHEGGEVKGAPPGLYATGELAAGPPHTWLAALAHGARAGESAAKA